MYMKVSRGTSRSIWRGVHFQRSAEEKARTGEAKLTKRPKQVNSKPLTLRQHALASVLNPESRSSSPRPLTYVQEQDALKKETVHAFHAAISEDEGEDLLVLREKTKDEIEKEEEEYKEFLEREVGQDLKELITVTVEEDGSHSQADDAGKEKMGKAEKKTAKNDKKKTKAKSSSGKEEEDHQFLLEYVHLSYHTYMSLKLVLYLAIFSIEAGLTTLHDVSPRTRKSLPHLIK